MSRAHRARRDESEASIIDALEAAGWQVKKLAQRAAPDLLAWRAGRVQLIECKTGKGKLRPGTQTDWTQQGLPVVVFRSAEDVAQWVQRACQARER